MNCILFLGIFGVYLYSLCPTVSIGDSGEFVTGAVSLSIPHASSYPLYCLLGKLLSVVITWANVAYRVNLLSALSGAGAVAITFASCRRLGLNHLTSLVSATLFALSPALFRNSVVAEVFALNIFFATALFYLTVHDLHSLPPFSLSLGERGRGEGKVEQPLSSLPSCPSSQPSTKARECFASCPLGRRGQELRNLQSVVPVVYLLSFLLGLGLGNHHTLILVLPSLVVAGFSLRRLKPATTKLASSPKFLVLAVVFLLLGLSIYLYLPLRANKNPPLNWGNPTNIQRLYRTVTRKDYGALTLALGNKPERTFATAVKQTVRFFKGITNEITLPGVIAGIAGIAFLWMQNRVTGVSILLLLVLSGPAFLLLGNLPFDAQSSGVLERFLIIPSFAGVVLAGHGLEGIGKILGGWFRGVVLLMFLGSVAFCSGGKLFGELAWRQSFLALDYGRNILRSLLHGTILFMDGGDDTFYTTAYLSYIEGWRPDVALADRGGLVFKNQYGADFRGLDKSAKELRRQEVERSQALMRPVIYSTMNQNLLGSATLKQEGFLYLVTSIDGRPLLTEAKSYGNDLWGIYRFRGLYPLLTGDYRSRALAPYFPFMRARGLWSADYDKSVAYLLRAGAFGWDIPWLYDNLKYEIQEMGYSAMAQGKPDIAEKLYKELLRHDSGNVSVLLNLGVVCERKNDFAKAKQFYSRALVIAPMSVDAHYNLAVALWRESDWSGVIKELQEVIRINPDHQGARYYLTKASLHVVSLPNHKQNSKK